MDQKFFAAIRQYAETISPQTKVFVGADSRRRKKGEWHVINYTTAAVFHLDAKHGCKVFATVDRDRDYHGNLQLRLMTEVYKAVELYQQVVQWVPEDRIEIHLDLNPSKAHKSNLVLQQAVGFVQGVTGKTPVIKPGAWAASTCSDLWELKFAMVA